MTTVINLNPQEYSNDGSPVAKRMRQSDGEAETGEDGGGGEEEDGYVAEGAEDAEGYYNHVDMYGRIVEEGEATPAQGKNIFCPTYDSLPFYGAQFVEISYLVIVLSLHFFSSVICLCIEKEFSNDHGILLVLIKTFKAAV